MTVPMPTDEPTGTWVDSFRMEDLHEIAQILEFNWPEYFHYEKPSPHELKEEYILGLVEYIFYELPAEGMTLADFPPQVRAFYEKVESLEDEEAA